MRKILQGAFWVHIVIAVVVIGGLAFGVSAIKNHVSPIASTGGTYCGPDGTFTDTMPIQSHRSYCLKSNAQEVAFSANTPTLYSFSIVDDQGNTTKDFEVTHTKQMHVIVVRKDLANFQHVHPDFDPGSGIFTLSNLKLPTDGEYRIFADFAPVGVQKDPMGMPLPVTISEDVKAGRSFVRQPIGSEEVAKTFGQYQASLATHGPITTGTEAMLMFSLKQNGKPVTNLEEYLGALGHSVVLREGTLDFIHAHPLEDASTPQSGTVSFMVDFPQPGKYKVFTQFQHNGEVFTTDFVVNAVEGAEQSEMPGMMPGMTH